MNEININEIVKIEQMPKVFSQLEKIGKYIDTQIKDIDKLECTEENKQEVKKRRTEINKTLELLDDRRKEIKTTLLEPYEIFNKKYEEECKIKLSNASNLLKEKIDFIEETQKKEKETELREFANEHIKAYNLQDIISFEDIGLNITLSASLKSLKEEIVAFVEGVSKDIELIKLEEYSDEILLEYKKCRGNFAQCKLNVLERHKQLDELKKQREGQQQESAQEQKIVEAVDEIIAPVEVEEKETYEFKITATKEQVKQLIEYMKSVGIEYE